MSFYIERSDTSGQSYMGALATTEGARFHQKKIDVSRFAAPGTVDSEGYVPPGFPIARNGGPVASTTLAAAIASATDTTADFTSARGFQALDVIDVNGTSVTIQSIAYGAGAGGSDRVTFTGQVGATKLIGAAVKLPGNDYTYLTLGGPGASGVKLPAADNMLPVCYAGLHAQAAVEYNLGRVLTAAEKAPNVDSDIRWL